MLAINLLPIILMLIFTPKDAYIKWRPGITFIFVLSYDSPTKSLKKITIRPIIRRNHTKNSINSINNE